MSPLSVLGTPENQAPVIVLNGPVLRLIKRLPHLIRKSDGDEIGEDYLKSYAWSALRMLGVIGMESEDDDDVCIAGEKAENIAAIISQTLDVAEYFYSACKGCCHPFVSLPKARRARTHRPYVGQDILAAADRRTVFWHRVIGTCHAPDVLSVARTGTRVDSRI